MRKKPVVQLMYELPEDGIVVSKQVGVIKALLVFMLLCIFSWFSERKQVH
jgi:hypothetical protein